MTEAIYPFGENGFYVIYDEYKDLRSWGVMNDENIHLFTLTEDAMGSDFFPIAFNMVEEISRSGNVMKCAKYTYDKIRFHCSQVLRLPPGEQCYNWLMSNQLAYATESRDALNELMKSDYISSVDVFLKDLIEE